MDAENREKLRKLAEGTPGTKEFAAAKKAAVKAAQIEKCYRQYLPPQCRGVKQHG